MIRQNMLLWSVLGLLIGAALRFHAVNQNVRFHPDEALFSTFARDAAVHGDWMLAGPLDKSPLTIYASALSMHFLSTFTNDLGVLDMTRETGEFAARIPNVFAGLVLIALIGLLARHSRTTPAWTTTLTIFLAGASPYLIVFAASAFTDTMMVMFGTASLLTVSASSGWFAGMLLALSIASKQQGLVYLPLLLILIWQCQDRMERLRGFVIALIMGVILLLTWDALRPGTSIFVLASENNSPEHLLAAPGTWLRRIRLLLGYGGCFIGPPPLTWSLLGLSAFYTVRERDRLDLILWLSVIGYFLAHCLLALNIYDRYLLPLSPIILMLSVRALIDFRATPWLLRSVIGGVVFVTLGTGLLASNWRIDLGRDHYPLDRAGEIIALADYLNQQPLGTILYNPWLGWELGYYLGPWSNKLRVHYPTPDALVLDALKNSDRAPRYFIAPTDRNVSTWLHALRGADFRVKEAYHSARYIVYKLTIPQEVSDA
jgi:hypothetical protein